MKGPKNCNLESVYAKKLMFLLTELTLPTGVLVDHCHVNLAFRCWSLESRLHPASPLFPIYNCCIHRILFNL
jgi:hypothetical protein